MVPYKRRSPGAATNSTRAKNEERRKQYTAILREFVGCVVLGAFIGVVIGSAILGMADAQHIGALEMQRAASMAEVAR